MAVSLHWNGLCASLVTSGRSPRRVRDEDTEEDGHREGNVSDVSTQDLNGNLPTQHYTSAKEPFKPYVSDREDGGGGGEEQHIRHPNSNILETVQPFKWSSSECGGAQSSVTLTEWILQQLQVLGNTVHWRSQGAGEMERQGPEPEREGGVAIKGESITRRKQFSLAQERSEELIYHQNPVRIIPLSPSERGPQVHSMIQCRSSLPTHHLPLLLHLLPPPREQGIHSVSTYHSPTSHKPCTTI
ncbi:unnamed protein product [Pleuronectes platessa]|uniref:Uncharacterized protein n=1 Tax=Pleuronectes platessa TaxID=8262 RepID=A0A9N7VFZ1_PLEPL|nr:unnamed protein product [Pleuronectes platessa]